MAAALLDKDKSTTSDDLFIFLMPAIPALFSNTYAERFNWSVFNVAEITTSMRIQNLTTSNAWTSLEILELNYLYEAVD